MGKILESIEILKTAVSEFGTNTVSDNREIFQEDLVPAMQDIVKGIGNIESSRLEMIGTFLNDGVSKGDLSQEEAKEILGTLSVTGETVAEGLVGILNDTIDDLSNMKFDNVDDPTNLDAEDPNMDKYDETKEIVGNFISTVEAYLDSGKTEGWGEIKEKVMDKIDSHLDSREDNLKEAFVSTGNPDEIFVEKTNEDGSTSIESNSDLHLNDDGILVDRFGISLDGNFSDRLPEGADIEKTKSDFEARCGALNAVFGGNDPEHTMTHDDIGAIKDMIQLYNSWEIGDRDTFAQTLEIGQESLDKYCSLMGEVYGVSELEPAKKEDFLEKVFGISPGSVDGGTEAGGYRDAEKESPISSKDGEGSPDAPAQNGIDEAFPEGEGRVAPLEWKHTGDEKIDKMIDKRNSYVREHPLFGAYQRSPVYQFNNMRLMVAAWKSGTPIENSRGQKETPNAISCLLAINSFLHTNVPEYLVLLALGAVLDMFAEKPDIDNGIEANPPHRGTGPDGGGGGGGTGGGITSEGNSNGIEAENASRTSSPDGGNGGAGVDGSPERTPDGKFDAKDIKDELGKQSKADALSRFESAIEKQISNIDKANSMEAKGETVPDRIGRSRTEVSGEVKWSIRNVIKEFGAVDGKAEINSVAGSVISGIIDSGKYSASAVARFIGIAGTVYTHEDGSALEKGEDKKDPSVVNVDLKQVLMDAVNENDKDNVSNEPKNDTSAEPEDGVTEESEDGVTEEPEDGVTGEPEDAVTEESEDGVTAESEDGVTEEPEDGVTGEPEDAVTEESEDGVTAEPKDGVTEEPEDAVTEEPEDGVTGEPEDAVTEEPEDGVTGEPEDAVTEEPEDGVTGESEDAVTEESEHDTSAEPEDSKAEAVFVSADDQTAENQATGNEDDRARDAVAANGENGNRTGVTQPENTEDTARDIGTNVETNGPGTGVSGDINGLADFGTEAGIEQQASANQQFGSVGTSQDNAEVDTAGAEAVAVDAEQKTSGPEISGLTEAFDNFIHDAGMDFGDLMSQNIEVNGNQTTIGEAVNNGDIDKEDISKGIAQTFNEFKEEISNDDTLKMATVDLLNGMGGMLSDLTDSVMNALDAMPSDADKTSGAPVTEAFGDLMNFADMVMAEDHKTFEVGTEEDPSLTSDLEKISSGVMDEMREQIPTAIDEAMINDTANDNIKDVANDQNLNNLDTGFDYGTADDVIMPEQYSEPVDTSAMEAQADAVRASGAEGVESAEQALADAQASIVGNDDNQGSIIEQPPVDDVGGGVE